MAINVTSLLTGDLLVKQGETYRKQYVATNATAWHNVTLLKSDEDFLKRVRILVTKKFRNRFLFF